MILKKKTGLDFLTRGGPKRPCALPAEAPAKTSGQRRMRYLSSRRNGNRDLPCRVLRQSQQHKKFFVATDELETGERLIDEAAKAFSGKAKLPEPLSRFRHSLPSICNG